MFNDLVGCISPEVVLSDCYSVYVIILKVFEVGMLNLVFRNNTK